MSGNPRNDKSEVKVTLRGMEQYTYMVAFNNGSFNDSFDTEDKGYFLLVTHITVENGRPIPTPLLTDVELLVKCDRRSEKNFNLALSKMDARAEEMVDVLEEDRKIMNDIPNFDKIIKGLKDAYYEEEKREKEERDNIPSFEEWKKKHQQKEKKQEIQIVKKEEKEEKKLTFDDIAGMEDVKEKLKDVIDQFNNPERYKHFGIKPIKAILLHGAPGTGKSFISNAFANEIDAKFVKVTLGDIGSKYQNETANNVRKIFEDARKEKGNVVLFLDEVDSIANKRDDSSNNKEKNNILNELLQQMSSDKNDNIFMVCATNYYELLDSAFKRRGRIDVTIEIPLPDFETRLGILKLNTRNKPLGEDVDLERIARNLSGMNCADVDVCVNESARLALKRGKDVIEQVDFEDTFEEMICGLASQTSKLDEETKRVVATHECGHLIANEVLNMNKTKKISILPRQGALGYLLHTNEDKDDVFLHTEEDLNKRIIVSLAGRVAEEIEFGKPTSGASNDLEKATNLMRGMVTKYGFSDIFGLLVIDENDITIRKEVNEVIIDKLNVLYEETKRLLMNNWEMLCAVREVLFEKEELNGDEVKEILDKFANKQQ